MCDRILILDTNDATRTPLEVTLERSEATIHAVSDAESALRVLSHTPVDVVFCSAEVPGIDGFDVLPQIHRFQPETPVVLTGDADREDLTREALRRGAWGALHGPCSEAEVDLVLAQALAQGRARRASALLRADLSRSVGERPIVAASDEMIGLLELLDRTAGYKSTVLVTGERGTGKESIARALHMQSPRREAPFVVFDCAARPQERAEAILFGAAGAHPESNAPAPRGLFADAHRGTIYLDDIERLPAAAQIALLRTIQSEEIEPVGDGKPVSVDVRVIAASAVDLEEAVRAGRFRQDLFDRLDVVRMRVPALRERREDLPLLVDHQLQHVYNHHGGPVRRIEDEALECLIGHSWPGNVRELELVIERAALTVEGDTLDSASLAPLLGASAHAADEPGRAGASEAAASEDFLLKPARQAFEARHILRALAQTDGNRTHAARLLGISHRALLYKIKNYGLRD